MSVLTLSTLLDPEKMEEVCKTVGNMKRLEEILLDPRVIELSRQSAEAKRTLATVVRRLQKERQKRGRAGSREDSSANWFDCINIMRTLSGPPKQAEPRLVRQRHKLTLSSPDLKAGFVPDVPVGEGSRSDMALQVCLGGPLPRSFLEFCMSKGGRELIAAFMKDSGFGGRFGSVLPTRCYSAVQCMDTYNLSDVKSIYFYTVPAASAQIKLIFESPQRFGNSTDSLRNLITSSTQTVFSAGCSLCCSCCESTESCPTCRAANSRGSISSNPKYKNVVDVAELLLKSNSGFTKRPDYYLNNYPAKNVKNASFVKTSKSQSAMYSTEFSECDCECDSSSYMDDVSDGKYLSRILTNAGGPNINHLTMPDVLISYSSNHRFSSDTDGTDSSCDECKKLHDISSESLKREPNELWAQKRRKTSCESCVNMYQEQMLQKRKYSCEVFQYNDGDSASSTCNNKDCEAIKSDNPGRANSCTDARGSILNSPLPIQANVNKYNENSSPNLSPAGSISDCSHKSHQSGSYNNFDEFSDDIMLDTLVVENEKNMSNCDNQARLPSDHLDENRSLTVSSYIQDKTRVGLDIPPLENEDLSAENTVSSRERSQAHLELYPSRGGTDEGSSSASRGLRRGKKHRRKTKKRSEALADSSSNCSLPRVRIPHRPPKPPAVSVPKPNPQQHQHLKTAKEKLKHKNCAIM